MCRAAVPAPVRGWRSSVECESRVARESCCCWAAGTSSAVGTPPLSERECARYCVPYPAAPRPLLLPLPSPRPTRTAQPHAGRQRADFHSTISQADDDPIPITLLARDGYSFTSTGLVETYWAAWDWYDQRAAEQADAADAATKAADAAAAAASAADAAACVEWLENGRPAEGPDYSSPACTKPDRSFSSGRVRAGRRLPQLRLLEMESVRARGMASVNGSAAARHCGAGSGDERSRVSNRRQPPVCPNVICSVFVCTGTRSPTAPELGCARSPLCSRTACDTW